MQLGRYHPHLTEDDFAYTPFKTFNRRRNFLVWLHNTKLQHLYTEEEKTEIRQCEDIVFRSSVCLKVLGLFLLINLRVLKRPVGRPIFYDFFLLYSGTYAFLGSNIPGVFLTWPRYSDYVRRMLESDKMKKRGLKN